MLPSIWVSIIETVFLFYTSTSQMEWSLSWRGHLQVCYTNWPQCNVLSWEQIDKVWKNEHSKQENDPQCRLEARGHLMTKKWSSISSQMDFGIRKYMVRGCQKLNFFWFWCTGTSQRTRIKFWPFYLVKRPKWAVFSSLWWTFYLTIFFVLHFFWHILSSIM